MRKDTCPQFSEQDEKKGRENFEYITSIIETHWIQSYNYKDKIMNKEAKTIANIF